MVNGTDRPQVRVLMVDDDLVDRRAVRRALGEGFVVTEAEDGSQARQSFDSAVPDCVLLDYNIPGTNTLELLDRFRQHAPVVMLTGQDDVEAAVAAMKAGAQDYLCKNEFSAERLNQAIHRSIDKAGRQRRELEARGRLRNEYRSEKRRRRQLEASLQIARDIQQNLIPSRAPQVDGFDFCGVCLPIEETAGDFFDYVPMGDGSLGVILGDISGHGIGPALLTAETRAYFRALSRASSDVGQVTTIVNRLLWDDVIGGRFATLFFARLDPTSRSLTYASAGHPAYLVHRSGQITVLDSQTPPWGCSRISSFPRAHLSLSRQMTCCFWPATVCSIRQRPTARTSGGSVACDSSRNTARAPSKRSSTKCCKRPACLPRECRFTTI